MRALPPRRRPHYARAAAGLWLFALALLALLADALPLAAPDVMNLAERNAMPSAQHWLGTDGFGRDLLSRLIHGARVSLWVALLCPALGVAAGGALGIAAGYLRGVVEGVAVVLADVLLALPALVLAIVLAAWLGGSLAMVVVTLGGLSAPAFMRVGRARALAVAGEEFVQAARALGAGPVTIMVRHLLPNVWPSLGTLCVLVAAAVVVLEGALSYLGLSVAAPVPSWGGMIAEGRDQLETQPHVALLPAAMLVLTVLAINALAGDDTGAGGHPAGLRPRLAAGEG